MFKSELKITILAFVVMVGYVSYVDWIKPYSHANSETKQILKESGIPFNKKTTSIYYDKAVAALKANCSNGLYKHSHYDFGCLADSPLPYFVSRLSTKDEKTFGELAAKE